MPSFPVLPESGGFFIFRLRAGLSSNHPIPPDWRKIERSVHVKNQKLFNVAGFGRLVCPLHRSRTVCRFRVAYTPGTGVSDSYTNPASALGEPSRVTPGTYGGPVDPFDPAYLPSQLVSIGAGGSLTVKFDLPIRHLPNQRFGIDFNIFGNSFFVVTNAYDPVTFEPIGTPSTDGSFFGNSTGATRVLVSRDGREFFELNPALAPTVDTLFPTYGAGDFNLPTDPALTQTDFAGLDLEQIEALYYGSAGGAGYDLAWAQDDKGRHVDLDEVSYIRVEVLSGISDIGGFASVCPTRDRRFPRRMHGRHDGDDEDGRGR